MGSALQTVFSNRPADLSAYEPLAYEPDTPYDKALSAESEGDAGTSADAMRPRSKTTQSAPAQGSVGKHAKDHRKLQDCSDVVLQKFVCPFS